MKDERKTKEQLINELVELRQRITELEASEAERKRAEDALRESEERYRTLYESSRDGIATATQDGRITECNQAYAEMLGYSREELKGIRYQEIMPSKWHAFNDEILREVMERGYSYEFEKEYIRKDGTVFPISLRTWRVDDEAGNPIGLCSIVRDITERKRAEEELKKYRDHLEELVEARAAELTAASEQLEREITERKRAEEALQQRNRELALLNQAGRVFSSTLDLDEVLTTVLDEVRRLLGVTACSVWLVDPETDELVCRQAVGPQSETVRGWRLAPGEGLAGWVARRGESLVVPDVRADERHFKGVDQQTGLPLRSILTAPLQAKKDVIGVIQAVDTVVGRFDTGDLALLEPLAASAAVAVENARLYDEAQREITERKQAEEALRDSRHMLQTVLDSIPAAVFWKDRDSIYLGGNRTMLEAVGLKSSEEIVGKSDYDLPWEKKQADSFREYDRRVMESGIPEYDIIEPYLRADGTDAWAKTNKVPLQDAEGNVVGILGTYEDITERKRAEEALQRAKREWESTFAAMSDWISLIDLQTHRILRSNRAGEELVGVPLAEVVGQTCCKLVHGSDRPIPGCPLQKMLDTHQPETVELQVPGEDRWLMVTVDPVMDDDGNLVSAVHIVRDITERKRAEEALRESEERYRAIFEQAPDSIVLVDAETGALVEFNDRAHENLGYTRQEFEKLKVPDFEVIESAEEVAKHIEKIIKEGADTFETKQRTKGGEIRDIQVSGRAISIRGKDFIQGIWRDITERKRAEEALRRSLEETARGQRLLLSLSQAAQAVQRARTPEEVYQTLGDEVAELGYYAAIYTLTDDRTHLALSHTTLGPALLQAAEKLTGLSAQDFRFAVVPGGIYDRILAEGQAAFFEQAVEPMVETLPGPVRPLAGQVAAILGLQQAILAPLRVGGEMPGLLVVIGTGLTEADAPVMTAFANQAAIALENAHLYQAERAAREQLRNLAGYLQAAREEERTQIAREIHDEFGQVLTALKMDLSWLTKRLPADKPHLEKKASDMSDLIDATIQTVRHIATELRPGLLDDLGLTVAIEWQAQEFAERTGIDCELDVGHEEIVLDRDLATTVFRIFQESLTNVARHAEATQVRVELEGGPDELLLIVRDNGKGIAKSRASDPRSLGLLGMRERAHFYGGDVTFQGVPGQGTTVTVRIPLAG